MAMKIKGLLKNILIELRISHWVKNGLVFLPLIFVSKATELIYIEKTLIAFFSFCFAASSVYVINDILDLENDKKHPRKKQRPIASGKISINLALIFASVLLITSIYLANLLSPSIVVILLAYLVLNLFYSKRLKHVPIVDIVLVSFFYIMRVIVGGVAIGVPISGWLFLTTFFVSLFLIIGKRRSEYLISEQNNHSTRSVLKEYSRQFLDSSLLVALTLSIAFYSLYSLNNHDNIFSLSIIIIIYGALRYMFLIYVKNVGEEPEKIIFTDKQLLISGIIWFIFIFITLYYGWSSIIKI